MVFIFLDSKDYDVLILYDVNHISPVADFSNIDSEVQPAENFRYLIATDGIICYYC